MESFFEFCIWFVSILEIFLRLVFGWLEILFMKIVVLVWFNVKSVLLLVVLLKVFMLLLSFWRVVVLELEELFFFIILVSVWYFFRRNLICVLSDVCIFLWIFFLVLFLGLFNFEFDCEDFDGLL